MFPKALLNTLLLSLALASNPASALVKIPLTRQLGNINAPDILKHDLARARYFAAGGSPHQQPIVNAATHYTAQVGVGSPPTNYNLLIDTGSSNTWLGADKAYVRTRTSVNTTDEVVVKYGSGNFTGIEYIDTVTLGSITIAKQSIGVASTTKGFNGVDGIVGIGPVDLTVGTLPQHSKEAIPTVTDNAYSQGLIGSNEIGISFEPTTSNSIQNGELAWGGVDKSKFTGEIHYVPITKTSPANQFWGVNQTVTYGSTTILENSAGIIDTGSTLVLLATDAFKRYQAATGAKNDTATTLLTITEAQFANLKPLDFIIDGQTYTLTPNAQIWPRALNTNIGGKAGQIYLIVTDIGTPSGQGLDFINGYGFLERYYAVYDTANKRVGFAPTPFTQATTN